MFTDVVFEQIVKKKFETKDYLKALLYIILCMIAPALFVFVLSLIFSPGVVLVNLLPFVVLVYIAAFIMMVGLIRNLSIEYEYTFVNGDLTIDKIIAKKKRKRMVAFDVKLVEDMGIYESGKFAGEKDVTKLIYTDTYSGEGDLYLDFRHVSIGRTIVVIKSSERIGKALKPFVKRSLHKEVFPDL